MLKIYCTECGAPTEYSLNKPKFCSSCGYSFNGKVVKKEEKVVQKVLTQKPTISKRPNIELEEYDDDEVEATEVNQVPNIEDLQYDIDIPQQKGQELGSIIGTSIGQENLFRKNKINEKIDKKQVLENLAREGGALRPLSRKSSNQASRNRGSRDG